MFVPSASAYRDDTVPLPEDQGISVLTGPVGRTTTDDVPAAAFRGCEHGSRTSRGLSGSPGRRRIVYRIGNDFVRAASGDCLLE